MIFKTFNSDIDKASSKIGIFGKSFNDIFTAINQRKIDINNQILIDGKEPVEAAKDVKSFWNYLYPTKEDVESKLVDVNIIVPEINTSSFDFDGWITKLNNIDKQVIAGEKSWQDYSNSLNDNEKWIAKWGETTQGTIRTQDDMIAANKAARESTIAYNNSLEQMTIGAKAGTAALKTLSIAGNLVAGMLITFAISKAVEELYNLVNAAKITKENAEEFTSTLSELQETQTSNTSTISDLNDEYKDLSDGVNKLGENVSLTSDEYSRYQEICNQVADIMPNMVQGYDDQGNAILTVKGNLADLNAEYEKYKQNEAIKSYSDGDVDSVFSNYKNLGKGSSMPSYNWNLFGQYFDAKYSKDTQLDYLTELSKLNNSDLVDISSSKYSLNGENNKDSILGNILRQYGLDKNSTDEEINTVRQNIKNDLQGLQTEIDTSMSQIANTAISYAQTSDSYWGLGSDSQSYFQTLLNGITPEFVESNNMDTVSGMQDFVNNLISILKDDKGGVNEAFNELFNFDLDDSDLTPEEIQKKIDSLIDEIAAALNLNDDDKLQLKISLGFDDVDDLAKNYDNTIESSAEKFAQSYKESLKKELESFNGDDTINFAIRPTIDTSELEKAGWGEQEDGTATVYSSSYSNEDGTKTVVVTPILPDGTVLSPEDLESYANDLLDGKDVDVDIKMGMFDGEDSIQQAEDFAEKIHELHEKYFVDGDDYGYDDLDQFFAENSINTQEEIDNWNEVTAGITDATKAKEAYLETKVSDSNDLSFTDAIAQVQTLSTGLDQLDKIYADVYDKEDFDWSSILNNDDFTNAFSTIGDSYDEFIQTVSNSPNDLNACQASFDKLTTAYLNNNTALDSVTDATKQSTISMMEQMGVSNAQEMVDARLLANKYALAQGCYDLSDATIAEYANLLKEADASDTASQYIAQLALEKIDLNNININTQSDVDNIIAIANAAGASFGQISALKDAMSALASFSSKIHGTSFVGDLNDVNDTQNALSNIEDTFSKIKSGSYKLNAGDYYAKYTGGSETKSAIDNANKSTGSTGSTDTAKEAEQTAEQFDFIQIAITRMNDSLSKFQTNAENTFKSTTSRVKAYGKAIDSVTGQIQFQQQAYDYYMQQANNVGLSDAYKNQINSGSLNIDNLYDDTLKQQIQDYQSFYEQAQKCLDSIDDLEQSQKKLIQAKIEVLITKYKDLAQAASDANEKINNQISLKEAWGGSASIKNYTSMNKNILTQIKYITSQNSQLKALQKTVKKGSETWYEYQQEIDSNNSSLYSLKTQMAENATAAAALASATASNKVSKYDASDDLLEAKSKNTTTATDTNKLIDSEIKNINKRQKAYDTAVSTDKSNLSSASKALKNTKSTKANSAVLKKIKAAVKAKKEISSSVLGKITDNSLLNKCLLYNNYLTAYETDKATADLYAETSKTDKADKASQKMSNLEEYYSNRQGVIQQKEQQINDAISLAEAQGYRSSKKYYDNLITLEKSNNSSLVTERAKLVASLAKSVENGSIEEYSPEWYELNQQIDDVTNSINESDLALVNFANDINQIDWSNFDSLQDAISNVTSETDFMINQLSRDDLASDKTGGLTDSGKAVMALRYSNYDTYMKQAENYKNEIAAINEQLATDPYNETLIDQKETYVKSYQDAINAAQDEKYAVLDLVEQGYDALQNKISDLISDYEDLLDAEKDAYDYQESIADKTKSISDIKKQLQVYANDTSEEAKAKIQSLTVSLSDAQKDLKDTQYDKMISNTKKMLSDLQDDLSDSIDDIISSLSDNFETLESSLNSDIKDVAKTITDEMTGIGYTPTTEFKSLISGFSSGKDIQSSTTSVVSAITSFQSEMIKRADAIAASVSTTTASTDVTNKVQSDGKTSLTTDANSAKSDFDKANASYNSAKKAYETSYDKYLAYKEKYGANSAKAVSAYEDYLSAKKAYTSAKSTYSTAKLKNTALQYLSSHLDTTTGARGDLSDLNKALYDEYGMRILDSSEVKELAKALGITSTNQSSSGDLYKELKALKINGFKVGSSNIPYSQIAWTQEAGQEMIADASTGGLLTRLGSGDKVFTNEMTDNLWSLAQLSPASLMSGLTVQSLPAVANSTSGNSLNINMGGMVINDASNAQEIANTMADTIASNPKMQKLLQSVTVDKLSSSYNSLNTRKYS